MLNSPDRKYGYTERLVLAGSLLALPFLTTVTPAAGSEFEVQQI